MPNYRFECPACGYVDLYYHSFDDISEAYHECPHCEVEEGPCGGEPIRSTMERVYDFSFFRRSMPEHYNLSAGKFVRNEQHFKDELRRQSDEASERVGLEHNFVPVDPRDKEALGVTDEGLDSTYDRRKKAGLPTGSPS